jgi:hypothetical protein
VSFDPDSNVNDESCVQCSKHFSPRISTEEGIQIDFSDEQRENEYRSIRFNLESDSNVNEEMEEQSEKHPSDTISISRFNRID